MILKSIQELENTKAKLRLLEDEYESALRRPMPNETVRQLTSRSLKRLVNQLKEEIADYEAQHAVRG